MHLYRKGLIAGAMIGLCLLGGVFAIVEAGAPAEQMQATLDALVAVLEDAALRAPDRAEERRAKIQQVLSKRFAYAAMAKESLGRHWNDLTSAQQQAFIPLFSSLLEQMHTRRIERYEGKKKSVVLKGDTLHENGTASVTIEIVDPSDSSINESVEYRLQKHKDVWMVHDLLIDDGSIITNFRTQFDRLIRKESYDELVRRLERSSLHSEKAN
jgi:phospholipid transport system substrate-binding protein